MGNLTSVQLPYVGGKGRLEECREGLYIPFGAVKASWEREISMEKLVKRFGRCRKREVWGGRAWGCFLYNTLGGEKWRLWALQAAKGLRGETW